MLPFATTFTLLHYQKKQLKRSIKQKIIEGIDQRELVLLKFSKKDTKSLLRWEHSKEFEYKKEMYDVVEKIETTDTITYWCWWDNEETKLNRQLSDLLNNVWDQNPNKQQKQQKLIQYAKNWYSHPANCSIPIDFGQLISLSPIAHFESISSRYLESPSPPPKFC